MLLSKANRSLQFFQGIIFLHSAGTQAVRTGSFFSQLVVV